MWSRCWWATWISGFFGIAGGLHLIRGFLKIPLAVGRCQIPPWVSVGVGALFLGISAGLLWVEVQRERNKQRSGEKRGA